MTTAPTHWCNDPNPGLLRFSCSRLRSLQRTLQQSCISICINQTLSKQSKPPRPRSYLSSWPGIQLTYRLVQPPAASLPLPNKASDSVVAPFFSPSFAIVRPRICLSTTTALSRVDWAIRPSSQDDEGCGRPRATSNSQLPAPTASCIWQYAPLGALRLGKRQFFLGPRVDGRSFLALLLPETHGQLSQTPRRTLNPNGSVALDEMIMEDSGPEASKRQRLDSMNVLRVHSQHSLHSGSPPNDALHSYPVPQQPLAPPNAYTDPIPPSPYQTGPEPRHLSEHPVPGNAYLSHSGYSTPVREAHPPLPERAPSYSRNGHAATAAEVNHAVGSAQFDAVTAAAAAGAHVYPPTSARDADPSIAPYGSHDPAPNGMYHGLSMSSHHDTQSPPPAATTQYAEMPAHRPFGHPAPGGPPYSAGTYSAPAPWANPQAVGVRKPSRALQVLPFFSPPLHGRLSPRKVLTSVPRKACETCRSRKAKCDEGKPKCSYCIENDHICKYKEVQPAKYVSVSVGGGLAMLTIPEVGLIAPNARQWTLLPECKAMLTVSWSE